MLRISTIFTQKSLHLSYLILFLLILLTSGFAVYSHTAIQNASKENLEAVSAQIIGNVENTIGQTSLIVRGISSSQRFLDFLDSPYTPGVDFVYYSTEIQNFLNTSTGVDFRSYVKIYMENSSIPEGYGTFYHLDSYKDTFHHFITGDQPTYLTFMNDSLIRLDKLYTVTGKFLGIVAISIPADYVWDGAELTQVLLIDNALLLNFAESDLSGIDLNAPPGGNFVIINRSLDYPPFTFLFAGEIPILYRILSIILWFVVAMLILVAILFFFHQKNSYRKTKNYLWQMDQSLNHNMSLRLDEDNEDEFSFLSKQINSLLDKIEALVEKSVQQEAMQKETQIQILQNQINPHFIYNTMEIFSSQMELYGHYAESDAMSSFAGLLRYNVKVSNHYAKIREELAQAENYINLQRLRHPNISLRVDVPEELLHLPMIRFLLQPFVENSVKHAMPEANFPLVIAISIWREENRVWFTIEDNGSGMALEEILNLNRSLENVSSFDDGQSVGLFNIGRRLRLFYGDDCRITASASADGGVRFQFYIVPELS